MNQNRPDIKIAIAGFGAIGLEVARTLDGGIDGLTLVAVSARDHDKARANMADFDKPVPVMDYADLADHADIVIECLPAAHFRDLGSAVIAAGKTFMPLSCGQLLDNWDLIDMAEQTGARIIVPTGALLGLDAVRAAAEGEISSVRMVTRKPPGGLAGAPFVVENDIDLDALTEPTRLFEGTARDAIPGFPANLNVVVALSLAGVGPDKTMLEVWADPTVTRNTHEIHVEADSARFMLRIENVPSEANPRTGKITALSTIACLRGLVSTLKVGS